MKHPSSLALMVVMCASLGACRLLGPTAVPDEKPRSPELFGAGALLPSHNLRVGTVVSVDAARGLAIIDLAADAPATALTEGAPLISRSLDLKESAHLSASRFIQGRTLGTRILSGQPSLGDEVVFPAP